MADDYSDILGQPESTAPVAVVRRPGESFDQMRLRHNGYSDEQTGYDDTGSRVARGGGALGRAAALSLRARSINNAEARQITRDDLAERKQMLDEQKYSLDKRIHDQSFSDTQAALTQGDALIQDVEAVASKYPRGTKDFYLNALPLFAKYPRAAHANARFQQMHADYEKGLTAAGGTPEEATALWELGQVDTADPSASAYLNTIPGKYPGAFQTPTVQKMFESVNKQVETRAKAAPSTGEEFFKTADEAIEKVNELDDAGHRARIVPTKGGYKIATATEPAGKVHNVHGVLVDDKGNEIYKAADDENKKRLTHLESLRGRANLEPDQKAYFDAEITKLKSAQGAPASAKVDAVTDFDNPDSYKKAFEAAPSGTVLRYKGKPYKKP